jgi:large subunit ribosomal protein L23
MDYNYTLKRPVLSEKASLLKENETKYTFEVNVKASKEEIKKAVEATFGIEVEKIRTAIRRGKNKRRGQHIGQKKTTKRAFVLLKDKKKIAALEEA